MGSSVKKEEDDVVVRLDIQRILTSSSWMIVDGKSHKVSVAHVVGSLAWALVKQKASHLVKGRTFLATQMDYDERTHQVILRYTNKPMGVVIAPEEE